MAVFICLNLMKERKGNVKKDVYNIITDRILHELEKGTIPWKRPFKSAGGMQRNLITKKKYRGINVFLLLVQNYESPYWLTYKQAQELKGSVRKGEKGTLVIFWNWIEKMDDETEKPEKIPFIRYYTVFNLAQIEGIEVKEDSACAECNEKAKINFNPIATCEIIINTMPKRPQILYGKRSACYIPGLDRVEIPNQTLFLSVEDYYSTLFHELGHATGHNDRLRRKEVMEKKRFGSMEYGKEELVAEMTSAFLCGHAGIESSTIENQAAYIDGWRKAIKKDTKIIVLAAAQAQKAADYILQQE